jgi:ABC-type uncharacterized transport system substrate-binding protein
VIRELERLGYDEGKNLEVIARFANGKLDQLPRLAEELVKLRVDVIPTGGSNDATAAKNATQTIPIVFSGAVSDPVGAGLVSSLARPGGNITGFTTIATDLSGKRLKLLKDAVPKLGRVAVLWDPRNAAAAPQWKEHQLAAKALGVPLHSMVVSSLDRYESAFQEAAKAGTAALSVLQGALAGAQPGGNMTGLTSVGAELKGKQLEILKEVVPRLSRVAYLWSPTSPNASENFKEVEAAAQAMRITVQSFAIKSADDIRNGFQTAVQKRAEAILMDGGGFFAANQKLVLEAATKSRLPTMHANAALLKLAG